MAASHPDTPMGPVAWVALECGGSAEHAAVLPALTELVDAGTVRVIDAVLIQESAPGCVARAELTDGTVRRSVPSTGTSSSCSRTTSPARSPPTRTRRPPRS